MQMLGLPRTGRGPAQPHQASQAVQFTHRMTLLVIRRFRLRTMQMPNSNAGVVAAGAWSGNFLISTGCLDEFRRAKPITAQA